MENGNKRKSSCLKYRTMHIKHLDKISNHLKLTKNKENITNPYIFFISKSRNEKTNSKKQQREWLKTHYPTHFLPYRIKINHLLPSTTIPIIISSAGFHMISIIPLAPLTRDIIFACASSTI